LNLTKKRYKLTETDFFIPNPFANICIVQPLTTQPMETTIDKLCFEYRLLQSSLEKQTNLTEDQVTAIALAVSDADICYNQKCKILRDIYTALKNR